MDNIYHMHLPKIQDNMEQVKEKIKSTLGKRSWLEWNLGIFFVEPLLEECWWTEHMLTHVQAERSSEGDLRELHFLWTQLSLSLTHLCCVCISLPFRDYCDQLNAALTVIFMGGRRVLCRVPAFQVVGWEYVV